MSGIERPGVITADVFPSLPLQLTERSFRELAKGYATEEMSAALERGLYIVKRAQLKYVVQKIRNQSPELSIEEDIDTPWDLLCRADEVEPDIIRTLLRRSSVRGWLYTTAEQLQNEQLDSETLAAASGELGALAAVAACRANLAFNCKATLQDGALYFPTLGKVFLRDVATQSFTPVELQSDGDGILRICQGEKVVKVPGPNANTENWQGERQYGFESDGQRLNIVLDDLTPGFPGEPVRRLTANEAEQWRSLLGRSWEEVVRRYPEVAAELSSGLDSIKPLLDNSRTIGVSSRHYIGAMALRMPPSTEACITAWAHEYGGHTNLNAVETLLRFYVQDAPENNDLVYAPWRDDPRPLAALLHGCYSFMKEIKDIRRHRMDEEGPSGTLTQFEYLLWLTFVKKGAEQLEQRARLTKNGRLFLETMHGHIRSLPTDRVGEVPRAMATAAVADHAALWRAHHLHIPDTYSLEAAVAAWRNNGDPPAGLWQTPVELRPDTQQAINFRARANLFRQAIKDPYSLHDPEVRTPLGSMPADVQYVLGHTERAEDAYLQTLTQPHRSLGMRALVGFGLVRMAAEDPAAQVILKRPELIRELMRHGRVKPNEVHALASWVSQSVPQQPLEL